MLKNDLRRRFAPRFTGLYGAAAVAALVVVQLVPLTAHAAIDVPADAGYQRFRAAVTGNAMTMKFSSGGTPLASAPGYPTGMRMTAIGPTTAEASRYAAAQTKYGPLAFRTGQAFTKGAMAASFARMAMNPYFALGMMALPYALDWFNDSGVFFDSSGTPSIADPTWNDGYEYGGPAIGWSHSFHSACGLMGTYLNSPQGGGGGFSFNSGDLPTLTCKFTQTNSQGNTSTYNTQVMRRAQLTPPPSQPPGAAQEDIEDKLFNMPRTQSEIEKIIAEGIKYPELMPDPAMEPVVMPPVDGAPMETASKTSTSTKVNPDGSKVEDVTTCKVVGKSSGSKLELSERCTTISTTSDPSGNVTGTATQSTDSETSSGSQPEPSKEEDAGFCDSLVGKLVCADMDTPDDVVPTSEKNVTYEPEDFGFGSGQCPPPYTWTDSAGSHSIDLALYCDKLTSVVRPLVILFATLSAFFIVAPGRPESA